MKEMKSMSKLRARLRKEKLDSPDFAPLIPQDTNIELEALLWEAKCAKLHKFTDERLRQMLMDLSEWVEKEDDLADVYRMTDNRRDLRRLELCFDSMRESCAALEKEIQKREAPRISAEELDRLQQTAAMNLHQAVKAINRSAVRTDPVLYQTALVYLEHQNMSKTAKCLSKNREKPLSRETIRQRLKKFSEQTNFYIPTSKKGWKDFLRNVAKEQQEQTTENIYNEVDRKLTQT